MTSGTPSGAAARSTAPLRVAIAHEWLVSYGGSERCVVELLREFPDAELLTSVLEPESVPEPLRTARPSLLQRLPGATRHHEWLLPLMPLAWRLHRPATAPDLVITSSHACAKAVALPPDTPHLCYCHTPMRYAWSFDDERERFPAPLRPAARLAMASFRRWDRRSATRVTTFVANSSFIARRIARAYGRSARVVHPPVRTDFFTPGGGPGDYFLYVGRLVAYKRADAVVAAFTRLPAHRLVVVGDGPLRAQLEARAPANVSFLGAVDDEALRELYRGARALVYPAREDFGIAMAEAQACGTPVIGLADGGALDIVEPGVTGWLLPDAAAGTLGAAVARAATEDLDRAAIAERARRFAAERFRTEMRVAAQECAASRV